MRICVVGCGAIGSIYGAHVAQQRGVEVWVFDTDQAHVDAINRHGLRLVGTRELTATVNATTDVSTIPNCDIVIIATKSNQTENAVQIAARLIRDSMVCSFQNGIGNEELIANCAASVVSGTVLLGGHIRAPGIVEIDSDGVTSIGPAYGSVDMARLQALADCLSAQGLETRIVNDPRSTKWAKLIFNAAANPLCALTRLSFGELYGNETLRALMYGLADEGVAVARALDVTLEETPRELLDEASRTAPAHLPSMLSDVLSERVTEIDSINGDIVKYGQQTNTPCPLNTLVTALVKGLERSWSS